MEDDQPANLSRAERETHSPCWDMSQERVFAETVCNQRFNFFLAFFGVSIVGAMSSKSLVQQIFILLTGLCVNGLLALKVDSTFERLQKVIEYIRDDTKHPETIITERLKKGEETIPLWKSFIREGEKKKGMFLVYQRWIPLTCLCLQVLALFVSMTVLLFQIISSICND